MDFGLNNITRIQSKMKYIVDTEEKWHELRRKYITASEAAVLIGQNPYSSPGKLKKESDFVGNAYTIVGQVLEPVVVDITNRILGTKFQLYEVINKGKAFYTKDSLGATPDAKDGDILLECKTSRPDTYTKYIKEPPAQYLTQVQVQMWCTNKQLGYLSIISTDLTQKNHVISWPIVIYKIKRNDELCTIIETEAKRFFNSDSFRVNSATKKQASELLKSSYERIHYNAAAAENESKKELKELMSLIKQRSIYA